MCYGTSSYFSFCLIALDRPGLLRLGRRVYFGFLIPDHTAIYFDNAVVINDPIPGAAAFSTTMVHVQKQAEVRDPSALQCFVIMVKYNENKGI